MKLIDTEQAVANLESIAEYVRAQKPRAARRIRVALETTADSLTFLPKMARRNYSDAVLNESEAGQTPKTNLMDNPRYYIQCRRNSVLLHTVSP